MLRLQRNCFGDNLNTIKILFYTQPEFYFILNHGCSQTHLWVELKQSDDNVLLHTLFYVDTWQ